MPNCLPQESINKLKEWISSEGENKLADWDISRDAPYFGFPIPNTENKYFYVWLDAPIGYFASLKHYAQKPKTSAKLGATLEYEHFIDAQQASIYNTEMVHFIGKDILYFHALFWPAILKFSGYRTPSHYAINGFLTVDGQKMSKSRGTFITARSYLDIGLNPEWLRYYFAAKSSGAIEDLDLNLTDIVNRVNSDLVGKFVNIAARASGFITKLFANTLAKPAPECHDLVTKLQVAQNQILRAYDQRNFAAALREIASLCDDVNAHVDQTKPWELAKKPEQHEYLHALCSAYLECFRLLTLYLKPILPKLALEVESYLNLPAQNFSHIQNTLAEQHKINDYKHLMKRMEITQIDALIAANQQSLDQDKPKVAAKADVKVTKVSEAKKAPTANENDPDYISIDDFAKVDLRLGKVLACDFIEGSDKLLQFSIDLGEDKPRNIFSGIRAFYQQPADLIDSYVIVVANLAPRKMRFGISEGMILSASIDDSLGLLTIAKELKVGAKIS